MKKAEAVPAGTMTCNILYSEGHGRIVWRLKSHPTATKKHLMARLAKFAPEARFIDYYYGDLTELELSQVIIQGKFPQ